MKRPLVVSVLASSRRNGFTATLLSKAVDALFQNGCDVEHINLYEETIAPCRGCFYCIRTGEGCIQKDGMGKNGRIYNLLKGANGLVVASPVYHWTYNAALHAFLERFYPTHWNGFANGIPFAAITCASNQGFQTEALRGLCKFGFTVNLRYIGGVAAHAALMDKAKKMAFELGERLSRYAHEDLERERTWFDETAKWKHYMSSIWPPFEPYMSNITQGAYGVEHSLPYEVLVSKNFGNKEAVNHLRNCVDNLRKTLATMRLRTREESLNVFLEASLEWTKATWKELLQKELGPMPEEYRKDEKQ